MMETDLILKIKNRDPNAIEVVVRKYTSHLFNASIGLGFSEAEADDLTQSVWTEFFVSLDRFEGRSSVRTFLFGILYNKSKELRRQNKRFDSDPNIEEIVDSHFDKAGHWINSHSPISPDRFLEGTQTLAIISKCLELLPFNQKMAFVLKEIEGESASEIGKILEVTSSNIGVLLFRAKNQLRECVERKMR